MNNSEIQSYLSGLAAVRFQKLEITSETILEKAIEILDSNIFDLVSIDASGGISLKSNRIAPGCKLIQKSVSRRRQTIRVVMHDKSEALRIVFEYLGLIKGKRKN